LAGKTTNKPATKIETSVALEIEVKVMERDARYGDFAYEATLADAIIDMILGRGVNLLPYQKQALRMILTKIARLVSGDGNWLDGWVDIAGYAILVARQLKKKGR